MVLLTMAAPAGRGAAEDLRALKEEWIAQRGALAAQRQAAIEARLGAEVDWANGQLERARMTRNVSQQAVAHAAIRLFEEALARVRARQPADLPDRTRRDLQGRLDDARQALADIDRTHRADVAALRDRIAVQVRPLAGLEDAALDDPRLMEALDAPERFLRPAQAPGPEDPPPRRDEETPAPPGREVGTSGDAEDWLPLLTVTVATSALEVVSVPVVEVRAEQEFRRRGQTSLLEVVIRTTPERVLLRSDPPPVFRAVEVPGHPTPDVLSWPTERNNWMLEVRCRPQRGSAALPALRLEVSSATARLAPLGPAGNEAPD